MSSLSPRDAAIHGFPTLGIVIVAAGRGERLGLDLPKAFATLDDRSLLEHALRTVISLPGPGQLVLVVPEGHAARTFDIVEASVPAGSPWQVSIEPGGRERHESVRYGLAALLDSIEIVLVHDAARPLAPPEVFTRVVDEVRRTGDGVIPALPVNDTLKRLDPNGVVISTEDRTALSAVQTPQGFPRESLAAAHETAQAREASLPDDSRADEAPTDDAEVLQRYGGTVRTVPGDPRSHKVTTPVDLLLLQGLLSAHEGSPPTQDRSRA